MTNHNHNTSEKRGRLYGVGVGPGDPELLTLKAQRILSQVPVVFLPQKSERSNSFARTIIEDLIDSGRQKVEPLIFPMHKDPELLQPYWDKATQKIHSYLIRGYDCAFITEGDPFLYGTFIYIFALFQKLYPEVFIEVIPGISSINAAAATAQLPLASNQDLVAIIPSTYCSDADSLRDILLRFDTIIMLKIHKVFDKVLQILEELKLVEQCVYIKRCSTKEEEIINDIRKLKGETLDYLSLLIVRKQ